MGITRPDDDQRRHRMRKTPWARLNCAKWIQFFVIITVTYVRKVA